MVYIKELNDVSNYIFSVLVITTKYILYIMNSLSLIYLGEISIIFAMILPSWTTQFTCTVGDTKTKQWRMSRNRAKMIEVRFTGFKLRRSTTTTTPTPPLRSNNLHRQNNRNRLQQSFKPKSNSPQFVNRIICTRISLCLF